MSQHVTSGTTRPTHPSPGFSRNDARLMAILSGGLGALGAVVGLAVGLRTYTPTAWFAALEVGAPAAWLGVDARTHHRRSAPPGRPAPSRSLITDPKSSLLLRDRMPRPPQAQKSSPRVRKQAPCTPRGKRPSLLARKQTSWTQEGKKTSQFGPTRPDATQAMSRRRARPHGPKPCRTERRPPNCELARSSGAFAGRRGEGRLRPARGAE